MKFSINGGEIVLKNLIKLIVISITLFYFNENIYAYEYIDSNNKNRVNDMIQQIYDAKEQYEDLAGEYVESIKFRAANSTGYWWPIGSLSLIHISEPTRRP